MTTTKRIHEIIKNIAILSICVFLGKHCGWEVAFWYGYIVVLLAIWIEHGYVTVMDCICFIVYPLVLTFGTVLLIFAPGVVDDPD